MVQALIDQGALTRNGGGVTAARPLTEIKIPPTVQGILASRIDRLAAGDKELLQTLAVIGKEFPLSLVRRVAPVSGQDWINRCAGLNSPVYLRAAGFPGDEYTFKHALTLEVAYNSMLTERKRAMHERIAAAIESQFAQALDDHLRDLARHYSRSGNAGKAIEYLRRAAARPQRSSDKEAIAYVNDALAICRACPRANSAIATNSTYARRPPPP